MVYSRLLIKVGDKITLFQLQLVVSLQMVCCCDETPRPKVTWEESVFISYTSTSQPIAARSQARNSNRAGIQGQELKRPWRSVALFAQFSFLYHLGLPTRGGPTHTVWTSPINH